MDLHNLSKLWYLSELKKGSFSFEMYEKKLLKPLFGIKARKGCIISFQKKFFAEIAPLKGRSLESLEEAKEAFFQGDDTSPSTSFAVDSLYLQKENLPFHNPSYSDLLTGSEEEMWELAEKSMNPFVKIKLASFSVKEAVSIIKRLKTRLQNKKLHLDFNQKWSLEKAIAFSSHFSPEDFWYLEEPTTSFSELSIYSRETAFPIAVDESLYQNPLQDLLSLKNLKTAIIKPTLFGGVEAISSLQKKLPKNVAIVLSSLLESKIGLLGIEKLHQKLALSTPLGLGTKPFFY